MKTDRIRFWGQAILMMASVMTPLSLHAFQAGSGAWLPVEHSSFRDHLASLSAEERTEQLRDWALIAASLDAEPDSKTPGDTLFTVQALRIDPLQSLTGKRVGPTRWLPLAHERVLAVIPDGVGDLLPLLGRIADEYRVESSTPPREVLVYSYRADEKTSELAIRKNHAVPGASLAHRRELTPPKQSLTENESAYPVHVRESRSFRYPPFLFGLSELAEAPLFLLK